VETLHKSISAYTENAGATVYTITKHTQHLIPWEVTTVSFPQRLESAYWQAIRNDLINLSSRIGESIASKYTALPVEPQNYSEFLKISNQEGLYHLPKRGKRTSISDDITLKRCRKESIHAPVQDVQAKQTALHQTHGNLEEARINETLN